MMPYNILPGLKLKGSIILPGDKSIAHRAVLLSAISQGKTIIDNFPSNDDCNESIQALLKLGIRIKSDKRGKIAVFGRGLYGLARPKGSLFIKESGTTFRLLLGLLSAQDFKTEVRAGISLAKRPMLRVIIPLRKMGAFLSGRAVNKEIYPPIIVRGNRLKGIVYNMPVASAQVKSAILLAGLYATGKTKVIELLKTRDHTERMLKIFKAKIKYHGNAVTLQGGSSLVTPRNIYVPGDLSSAAFFMVAAAVLKNSQILIRRVSLNPSRMGVVKALRKMGADIKIANRKSGVSSAEPSGDILVKSSRLKGIRILKKDIPTLIDELPVLMVAAAFAEGETILEGAEELRVKETDRIKSMLYNLEKMGVSTRVFKSKKSEIISIRGTGGNLNGARLRSFKDHRTAMSSIIAGLAAKTASKIDDISCINKSFPEFLGILKKRTAA